MIGVDRATTPAGSFASHVIDNIVLVGLNYNFASR
jgi:hypothetical protein